MVKTHSKSRFSLLTLENIRDTSDVILQVVETGTKFDNGKMCYLCEVVKAWEYDQTETADKLTDEIIKVNAENRRLRSKITRLENELKKVRATQ